MATKFIRCKVCGQMIPQNAKMCPYCWSNNKQPFYKKPVFWALVCFFFLIIVFGNSSDDKGSAENTAEAKIEATTEQTTEATEEALTIELIPGEPGEYGEILTLNEGTEGEESQYVYRIPAGTYTVTNTGEYMNQFNVYSDEVIVTEYGWEEPADGFAILLDVGESDTFTIEDGQYIEIHPPGKFLIESE